jgi:hypothetical protein
MPLAPQRAPLRNPACLPFALWRALTERTEREKFAPRAVLFVCMYMRERRTNVRTLSRLLYERRPVTPGINQQPNDGKVVHACACGARSVRCQRASRARMHARAHARRHIHCIGGQHGGRTHARRRREIIIIM